MPPPPPSFPVVKRIPADQPFVVRPDLPKRAVQFTLLGLILLIPVACLLGLAASDAADTVVLIVVLVLAVLLIAGLLSLQLYLLVSGGPVLAVGPAGLWIKTRPTRGQAIWLPWEAIERIYRRRWSMERMLCVKPRDPRVGGNLGGFTALDSGLSQLFFGSGFTATVNFADKPEQEIMAAVAYFSAGRVPIF